MTEKRPYTELSEGRIDPHSLSIEKLFAIASQAAVAGESEIKYQIYGMIVLHPQVTENDKLRITISDADLERQQGEPAKALQTLTSIKPVDAQTRIEWLQAMGACHMALFDHHRQQAISMTTEAYNQSKESEPPDKTLYRLETLLARMVTMVQLDQFDALMEEYDDILTEGALSEANRKRAEFARAMLKARRYKKQGKLEYALLCYRSAFGQDVADLNRTVAALEYLACGIRAGQMITIVSEILYKFYLNHKNLLTLTIINALRSDYDLVEAWIAKQK